MAALVKMLLSCWTKVGLGPRRVSSLLKVDWDENSVRVRVLDRLPPFWNQDFLRRDVMRVCFKDEGLLSSDLLFVEVRGREKPICVLAEADGGSEFFGQLVARGLFPQDMFEKAVASSSGEMLCWPPKRGGSDGVP